MKNFVAILLMFSSFAVIANQSFVGSESQNDLTLTTGVEYFSNLHRKETVRDHSGFQFTAIPRYQYSKELSFDSQFSLDKEMNGLKEWKLGDSSLGTSFTFATLENGMTWLWTGRVYLPTNKVSRKDRTMVTKIQSGVVGSWDLSKQGVDGLSLSFAPTLTRGFYKFEDAKYSGRANTQWRFGQATDLSYAFNDQFSLSGVFGYTYDWSHTGARLRDQFYFGQSVSWHMVPGMNLSLGHTNGGNATKDNGTDSNLAVFRRDNSSFYSSFSFTF